MILYNLKTLINKKSYKDKKKYTYQEISDATGISKQTLSRINSTPNYTISSENLEKLCRFFNCKIEDLITIHD
ncbi:XRE family transcriptional regulator [Candidatus Magnetomorum sp. HK-1]|nr:XRE family transcriptional regulator [Candidatus Magnetomorum sp. HK-1]